MIFINSFIEGKNTFITLPISVRNRCHVSNCDLYKRPQEIYQKASKKTGKIVSANTKIRRNIYVLYLCKVYH